MALAAGPLPDDPLFAVAPLALRGSDVTFEPSPDRSHYGLNLNYDRSRLAEALRMALEQDVNVLLVPEMALPEGDPARFDDEIGDIIRHEQAEFFARTGRMSVLGIVVAGVLGGIRPDGMHRNYAVMFDADGKRAKGYEQLKLSHWDLSGGEQVMFGIDHHHPTIWPLRDPVIENCRPAETFTVLDAPGLGRTGVMICADMSQNNPGDWLGLNAMLDILFAPIMDKSICWQISDSVGHRRPWIVRRTLRSALLAGSRVIATNSVALSGWVNETNRRTGSSHPLFTEVGVGLAIDGRSNPPMHAHVLVPVSTPAQVAVFSHPTTDWTPFPPAV